MNYSIHVKNLSKSFGAIKAVDNLNFSAHGGEILGLLGPNGAGKSTTMKLLTGYLAPTQGTVEFTNDHKTLSFPHDVLTIQKNIGYLPEGAPGYSEMTVALFLDFIASVRGLQGKEKAFALTAVIDSLMLGSVLNQTIETLSKGFRRRVSMAAAIVHSPPILILDEPTDGLDPNQKKHIRELITTLKHDRLILISTHILEEVTTLCSRVLIIGKGKLIVDRQPAQLLAESVYRGAILIQFHNLPDLSILQALSTKRPLETNVLNNQVILFPFDTPLALTQLEEITKQQNWTIHYTNILPGKLEDVFATYTTGELS